MIDRTGRPCQGSIDQHIDQHIDHQQLSRIAPEGFDGCSNGTGCLCLDRSGDRTVGLDGTARLRRYISDPRATRDVDVMVSYEIKDRARQAIEKRWPQLRARELEMVIRFLDPGETDGEGKSKPVLNLMLPWSPFQQMILTDHIKVDGETGHHLPTLEAALESKYAAMVSSYRAVVRKAPDAVDFRAIVQSNRTTSTSNACAN